MNSWDWQLVVALVCVCLAAGLLARRVIGLLRGSSATGQNKGGCGLGGCSGCAAGRTDPGPRALVALRMPED